MKNQAALPLHFPHISHNCTPGSVIDYAPSNPATERTPPRHPGWQSRPSRQTSARRQDDEKMTVKPDDSERRSRDTRPQPARRGADPATTCKAAIPILVGTRDSAFAEALQAAAEYLNGSQ